jgi:hypothetical protein
MPRSAARLGPTAAGIGAIVVVAVLVSLAWPHGDRVAREGSPTRCSSEADTSPAANARPAVIALLGDERDKPVAFDQPHVNRLLRISLPDGEIERERTVGQPLVARDQQAFFRLNLPGASVLAPAPDGKSVLALVREPAPGRDSVAVVDAATLEVRCRHPLTHGVRYTGLLLGRSGRFYAYGSKPAATPGRWDAVLTIGDARTGELEGTQTLRRAASGKWRGTDTDWFIHSASLSPDERRIAVSYHGHDTTGADVFRLAPGSRVHPSGIADRRAERRCSGRPRSSRCWLGWTDIPAVHGMVATAGTGLVGAAAESGLVRLDRAGRVVQRMGVRPTSHLMDFAFEGGRSPIYASSCWRRPTIQRVDLARRRQVTLPTGRLCGQPLAVHGGRFLILSAPLSSKPGYTADWPQRLLLIDLHGPASGTRVRRSGTPIDAVVVGARGRAQELGSGDPAKKKNQISKASTAATTLTTTTRSTPLIPSLLRASSSLSPRMLRSHGEVRRAAGGRPVSSS